jgi:hypothetical protein
MAKSERQKRVRSNASGQRKKRILKNGSPANPVFVLLLRAKKRKPRYPEPERRMIFLRRSMAVDRSQIRS